MVHLLLEELRAEGLGLQPTTGETMARFKHTSLFYISSFMCVCFTDKMELPKPAGLLLAYQPNVDVFIPSADLIL